MSGNSFILPCQGSDVFKAGRKLIHLSLSQQPAHRLNTAEFEMYTCLEHITDLTTGVLLIAICSENVICVNMAKYAYNEKLLEIRKTCAY